MVQGKAVLGGAQIVLDCISVCPPGQGFPVDSCPTDTTGYVGHCPKLVTIFFCLWINSLPLNVASSFDLLPSQGGDQTFSDVFQHWKTKLVSFLEAGCGILEMNSSLVVSAACCDLVWEPPCAFLLVWSTGRVCT